MGAKFAPSVASAFMAQWEEHSVYENIPMELTLYKRFIDDIFIVWNGSRESLKQFLHNLNQNDKNISLTWNISDTCVNFLDLDITIVDNALTTKTHFKNVDANSYISMRSCHHKSWLFNIPKGQLTRIRRNCTHDEVFKQQATFIGNRFKDKGYTDAFIHKQIETVTNLDRKVMLQGSKRIPRNMEAPMLILDYNIQHREVEKVVRKHWHILKSDRHLKNILPDVPKIVYKKAPTLRDLLVRNVMDPPKSGHNFFTSKGFVPCKYCYACRHSKKTQNKRLDFSSTTTGQTYPIRDFISCHTEGVVYVLQCTCNLQYVGRTKRPLMVRIREHIQNIKKGFPKHSVSKHFALVHDKNPAHLTFWAIEKYKKHWRGAHMVRSISQIESRWIFTLRTMVPDGMNVEFDLNCFLNNF